MTKSTKTQPLRDQKNEKIIFDSTSMKPIGIYVFEVVEHEFDKAHTIRVVCHVGNTPFMGVCP